MDASGLDDEADALLTRLVAVWEGLPPKKRSSFGVERGIKICTLSHAARPKWRRYGKWATVEELDAEGMVSCRDHAPPSSTYPRSYILCEITAKGQAYVRARRGNPRSLKRLFSFASNR